MSGGFPLLGGLANAQSLGGTSRFFITPGATSTKGAWTQVLASSSFDTAAVLVGLYNGDLGLASRSCSVDIGVGGSGAEIVVIPDLLDFAFTSGATTHQTDAYYLVPITIPAGTRISARAQSSASSSDTLVQIFLLDATFVQAVGHAVDTIGFVSSLTLGTSISAGAGSKGSYSQLIASTPADYAGFFVIFDMQNANYAADFFVDIAVGAGGAEVVIMPNLFFAGGGTNLFGLNPSSTPFLPISIPAGTRVSARAQSDDIGTDSIGITLYGIRQ